VNVGAVAEGLLERGDAGDMGEQAQLDLRIVGRDQFVSRLGDESLADLAAFLGADRDVLQIGIVRREPPGRGHRHAVAGMHPAGLGIDLGLQRFSVSAL
jgi:hypothetical protein